MFVVFVGALTVFLIIGMLLAWVGNKILLSILKADNLVKEAILDAKTQAYELKLEAEKEIKERKMDE